MERMNNKLIPLSNSLENLLFPPGKYTAPQLLNLIPYFNSTFTLDKHKETLTKILQSDEEKLWWTLHAETGAVEAKMLALLLLLQLVGKERREFGAFNEGLKSSGTSFTPLSSPRSKTTRALYISNQQSVLLTYIKENLKTFLRLLSNEPSNEDPVLTAMELNPLSLLFKVDKKKPFSSNIAAFASSNKAPVSTIYDQLINKLTINDTDIVSLQGISLGVLVKEEADCRGKDLRIIGCEDSEIFIDSAVASVYIVNCLNCTIYVAACEKVAFVDKCQKVSITVSANLLRICNSVDSTIYYYGPSPVIMTGDNRSVQVGPNNSLSPQLSQHIKNAGIPLVKELLGGYKRILCKSITANNATIFSLLKPQDFNVLIMPKSDQVPIQSSLGNLLAEPEYIKKVEERYSFYNQFKSRLGKLSLSKEAVSNLHSVYQGSFKEWMTAKGATKSLNDLVKMIQRNN